MCTAGAGVALTGNLSLRREFMYNFPTTGNGDFPAPMPGTRADESDANRGKVSHD